MAVSQHDSSEEAELLQLRPHVQPQIFTPTIAADVIVSDPEANEVSVVEIFIVQSNTVPHR
jgi:hypothetical protein